MVTEELLSHLELRVLKLLRENLPPNLFYHSPEHTLDVVQAAAKLAVAEGCSPQEILLIKTAALFHDTGYVRDMREHERNSCNIAREMLSVDGVTDAEITKICNMIMATRMPQVACDKACEILCDADLDYLGREDYFPIADNLFREFMAYDKIKDVEEWKALQIRFLETHRYFTKTSNLQRQPGKEKNLEKIKSGGVLK